MKLKDLLFKIASFQKYEVYDEEGYFIPNPVEVSHVLNVLNIYCTKNGILCIDVIDDYHLKKEKKEDC